MKIYEITPGLEHTGVTTLEDLPTSATGNTITVIVGDTVNLHRSGDTRASLETILRKINEDHRIANLPA
jgi:hypothetical protein